MKTLKSIKSVVLGVMGFVLLVGFTGQEKFVELEGFLNGRSSNSYRKVDRNVLRALPKGTRGEILEARLLPSGNHGLKVKVLEGPQAGKQYWVYYNRNNPSLALYTSTPENWKTQEKTEKVEEAKAVETIRDTGAYQESLAFASAVTKTVVKEPSAPTVPEVISSIEESNEAVGLLSSARPPRAPECRECLVNASRPKPTKVSIVKGKRAMAPRCEALMSSGGQFGPIGKSIYSIMAETKYKKHYIKSNALGKFCPNFNSLSGTQKLQAWTWFWTALAQEESHCQVNVIHQTTYRDRSGVKRILNPRQGYGLWAMEKDRNVRRSRGAACNDISTGAGQARCSIDIMTKTQLDDGHSASSDSGSYWGPVRRSNAQMMPHMRRFSLCF